MNSKFKRLLACLLSLMMVVSLFPMSAITASAAEAAEADEIATVSESTIASSGTWGGIDWTLTTDGTLTIAPTKGTPTKIANKKTEFTVGEWPEAVIYNTAGNGASIGGYPYDRAKVKKLVIEEGVTSIGSFATNGFNNLTGEVVIPSTVTYIGQSALAGINITKLTFAEGGTGSLTIAQGGLNNNPYIEEVIFPADRSEIHLKAWVLNNCIRLKHVTFPANVKSISGTNFVDYYYFSTGHNSGNHSQLLCYSYNMESVTFGSEEVKDLFFNSSNALGTPAGSANQWKLRAPVASVGLNYCISLEVASRFAQSGDTIILLKNTDEAVELPAGVTLDTNGFTAANVTFAKPSVAQIGEQGFETLADAFAEANKAAGDYTITLLTDNAETFAFAQNAGVNITVDGNGKTFTGKITLNAGAGSITFKNATITPSNADAKSIVLNAATAPDITIDGCTLKNTGTKGAIVWGLASSTANKVVIKNSTASNLQYLVGTNQAGCVDITVENVTATGMAYLIRPMKATKVTVKDVTYSGLTFIEVRVTSQQHTLAIEDVTVNTTQLPALLMDAPEAGDTPIPYIITIKGDLAFSMNGVAATGTDWIATENAAKCPYVIKNLNGLAGSGTEADPYQIGSVEDLIKFRDSVNAGETKYNAPGVYVALTADIDMAGATWERGIGDGINATFDGIFDGKNFTIKNLNFAPKADNENPETAYLCGGLFGYTYGAVEIKNLVLENITVTSTDAGHNVGVLVGFANNNGGKLTVSNVTVKNVTIDAPNAFGVGAIVGYSYRAMGTIENCTVDGATIKGQRFVGGITGYSYSNATITGCTVKNATISGQIGVGGIAGLALSGNKITDNTVADTTVSAPKNWGYVVGELGASSANVSNNTAAEPQIGGDYATGEAYVAKIGDKYYTTLQAAVDAAKAEDTITLIRDIATSETITIADGKKITLDMNGKKITATDNKAANASYELFYIYGELAVTGNGTIELTSTSNDTAWAKSSTIFHNRGGILTIENGTFTHKGGTCMAYVVDNSGNWYGDATTVINGGTLTSTYTAIRNRMEQNTHGASGKAILVINGGTIDGTTSAIWAQAASTSTVAPATGSITVNGGNIGLINTARSAGAECMTTINGGTVASFKGETGELTVNGGKITGTITICHDNGDVAKYKVKKDGVYYAAVAKVGVTYYATLQEAIDACSVGGKVTLVDNAKGPGVVINKDITINFNGKTYTLTEGVGSTGTESNGFQVLAGNKVTLSAGTLKVAEEAADKFYILIQNYADLSCFNMNLDGTYLDKWSKTDGDSYVLSNNSGYISLTGKTYITTNNDGDKAFAFDACDSKYYADKPVVFAATTVKIDGKAVSESYDKIEAAARIGSTQFFASLKEAFAYASNGNTIKLMADVAVSEGITNTKKVTLDLNGKTITGTDNATGSFAIITNKGQLTITGNGKITLTATNNRGWNAYSSVISNTVGGKLIVENGTIEHLGGTDMAYAIDNLTNGKGTYAETVINGGTIKSTYRAIRMFLNGVEAQNILTVNGGVIEGTNKSIWMQDPSKNANTGDLTITSGAIINGDVYLTVTAGSTEWPVEVSIAASAVNGEVLTSNVPAGYKLVETKGVYSVEKVKVYIAQVGVTKYESLQAAIDACPAGGKVTLLCDAKGPGVVINKNITILFNGHTYTITEPVGSAGTETLGFQILKGNKVVLNNGKIEIAEEAADKFAILIQNYGDLTVYQMTLDGTNLGRYENYSYVLSVNCGKVTVNGKSVLTAKDGEGNYALDVYDYSSAGYSLPTVTVTSVVKINGKISAGAKYSTVYYSTVEQAKAANPGKNVTVLN